MKLYYVYVLRSLTDKKLYTGFTEDLRLRFQSHVKDKVPSTADRGPFALIYYEACTNKADATKRERYLKTHYGKQFLYKRLKSYFTG